MSDPQGQDAPGQETPGTDVPAADTPGSAHTAPPDGPALPASAASPAPAATPASPAYADRSYRSVMGAVAGSLLIVLTLWLSIDAMVIGHGRAPWYGLATLVLVLPLVGAYTVWPCVRANQDRLLVRNPLRTVSAPWSEVESIEAALSVELRAGGRKFQLWAVPVSLRQRKRANRRAMIAAGDASQQSSGRGRGRTGGDDRFPVGGPGLRSRGGSGATGYGASETPRAWADQVVDELRELADAAEGRESAVGTVSVAWTWWLIAPIVVGAVALVVLFATS
ncbi:hypothetical protein ABIA33_005439 [Streptacidiphilus sp. MAP12-16]|uniref:PH domain-containing protein n=1 Tax=Streptacidiphilus sp. MAP12-16 TaxID=3156300 RepID=UPI003518B9FB